MSSFHFLLSVAIGLNSLQLVFPAFVNVLRQLFLDLPLFLEPCGFRIRAALHSSWLFFRIVANPPKLVLPYFNIDVFLVGFFPEFFIRVDSRPPNSTDVSQAPINEGLYYLYNFI
jgi:hypothetical protein